MDIKISNLEHRYMPNTPFERMALQDINLSIPSGTFLALIGHTGSGKSTLIQHINGLLKPTQGSITIGETMITAKKKAKALKELRRRVGIVFQYPEHQLFDETVEKDICFGPMNFGVSEGAAKKRAKEVAEIVGLPTEVLQKSPFDLSGGQMRRVAIAGVLAMDPQVLILDEPTAGLDPRGRVEIMELFSKLHKEKGLTTILVTHSMEDAARYADKIVVMEKGTVHMEGNPEEVFAEPESIRSLGLDVPETVEFSLKIERKFGVKVSKNVYTMEALADEIASLLKKEKEGIKG
ncbi:energy-coupling factor ABC transporter ATP-binding protein [Bacillus taeanensis]|uniref:Energy-coupling factor transporter ATP-binding protein EcfA2 n=1 Tax=Bacillus taeanensis TaxID=273032 RepID=A0A366XPY5_9BACI|nr:energy-coupling factor ABC transporter ATP-binding protein [Bacillus taeanensis]RBW67786.1 energy-coupling factor ABC transporter ATP-binding protein [Bacillus taeanensis]